MVQGALTLRPWLFLLQGGIHVHKIKFSVVLILLVLLPVLAGCANSQKTSAPVQPIELNVSAALGLKDALLAIQQAYEQQHPQIKIVFNFAATGSLQRQIEQGAPADIFISAAHQQVDALQAKGLIIRESRRNLVGNKLVLIIPRNSSLQIADFKDVRNPAIRQFAMGAPETVPAGEYAKQVFRKLQIWDQVKEKAVLSKDVLSVIHYVATGNVDAGVAFSTAAATNSEVKVIAEAPPGSHEEIIFPGAVLTTAKNPEEAMAFLDYLSSAPAVQIFAQYGFSIPQ